MVDRCGTPFWGKQKPLKKYFEGGSLSFSVKNGKLFRLVTQTTKRIKQTLLSFEVTDKTHLDFLLSVKSLQQVIK